MRAITGPVAARTVVADTALALAVLTAGGAAPARATAAPPAPPAAVLPAPPAATATLAKLILGRWPGEAGTRAAARLYGYPYPHPPACTGGGRCVADRWLFYRGQCTSWVAYRLNEHDGIGFSNYYGGEGRWGNAVHWAAQARKLDITVNATPSAGSIAWYAPTGPAPDGHVAYVERVKSPTSFVMSEMNYDARNGFWVHTISKAAGDWPAEFIHVGG